MAFTESSVYELSALLNALLSMIGSIDFFQRVIPSCRRVLDVKREISKLVAACASIKAATTALEASLSVDIGKVALLQQRGAKGQ
ncbi:hypothetical protein ACN47E_009096 [Coniothyrium glycines]